METTNHQTYHNKKKYHKVHKYLLKIKIETVLSKPIMNRTYATYARVSNGKQRPPHAKVVVSN